MEIQSWMTGFLELHVLVISAFAGWVLVSRAPAILHAPLISGCAFLNGIIAVAGLYFLLNARTPLEQIAGFCTLLLGAANAAGEYAVSVRSFAMFRVNMHSQVPVIGASASPTRVTRTRVRRGRSKSKQRKKV
jgi:NAD(P) transhydrogenase subunit alpha